MANTVIDPDTMMIETFNTSITHFTVFRVDPDITPAGVAVEQVADLGDLNSGLDKTTSHVDFWNWPSNYPRGLTSRSPVPRSPGLLHWCWIVWSLRFSQTVTRNVFEPGCKISKPASGTRDKPQFGRKKVSARMCLLFCTFSFQYYYCLTML